MPRPLPQDRLDAVIKIVSHCIYGGSVGLVMQELAPKAPRRTVAAWLYKLVEQGMLVRRGGGWRTRYFLTPAALQPRPAPKYSKESLLEDIARDIQTIVQRRMSKLLASEVLAGSAEADLTEAEQKWYVKTAKARLRDLSLEKIAEYEITPEEFAAWKSKWR